MAIPSLNCHPKLHFPVRFHLVPIPLHFWKIGERFSPFYSSAMRNNRCRVIFLYSPICDPPCLQNTGMCGPVQRRFIYHRLAIPSLTPKFFNLFLWFTGCLPFLVFSPKSSTWWLRNGVVSGLHCFHWISLQFCFAVISLRKGNLKSVCMCLHVSMLYGPWTCVFNVVISCSRHSYCRPCCWWKTLSFFYFESITNALSSSSFLSPLLFTSIILTKIVLP